MRKIEYLTGIIVVLLAVNLNAACFAEDDSNIVDVQYNHSVEQELREVITDIKYQLISAQKEIEKLQDSNYNFKNNLSQQNSQIESLQKEKTLLGQTISSRESEIQKLSSTNDALQNSISNYKQKIENLNTKIAGIYNELTKTQGNNLTYTKNYEQLMREKRELEKNCSDLQLKVSRLEREQSAVNLTNQTLQGQSIYLKAIDYLKKDKANSVIFYCSLAKAYQDSKNYSSAIENYKLALSINPDFPVAHRELGIVYAEAGKYGDSVSELNKYLKYVRNPQEEKLIKGFISKIQTPSQ